MAAHATPPVRAAGLADSLTALARRHGVAAGDDASVLDLLAAVESNPLIPHELLLVAGTVMAGAFRHDRLLATPPEGPDDGQPSADCTF